MIPIVDDGEGVWSFIHVEDAAGALGVYNIVDDQPSRLRVWLGAFADFVGAPPPARMTETDALQGAGPQFVYYPTRLRGASNLKARGEFDFRPRRLEWLDAAKKIRQPSDRRGSEAIV